MGLNASAFSIGPAGFENDIRTDRKLVEYLTAGLSGVATPADFKVTPGPAHNLRIAAGEAVQRGRNTPASQGSYFLWSDGQDLVDLPSPQANPYIVTVVQRVIDPQYGVIGVNSVGAQYQLVPGVPAATPIAPSDADITAYGGNLPGSWESLAEVRINPANSGVIPAGQIVDKRTFIPFGGGPVVCTSTTRPLNPPVGLMIYETDTLFQRLYTGNAAKGDAGWIWMAGKQIRSDYVNPAVQGFPNGAITILDWFNDATVRRSVMSGGFETPSIIVPPTASQRGFQVKEAGVYRVRGSLRLNVSTPIEMWMDTATTEATARTSVWKDQSIVGNGNAEFDMTLSLAKNAYIWACAYQGAGSAATSVTGRQSPRIQIEYLGTN